QLTVNVPVTITSATSGVGSLNVAGTNTLTLAGPAGHVGATTVSAGTLLINTVHPAAAAATGGLLGGTGSIGLLAGANLAPINPGGAARGILDAAAANLGNGGNLTNQIPGFAPPGLDYDRPDLANR